MTIGIYRILNLKNDKCYIGQSKNVECRIKAHKKALRKNEYGNKKIQNAWNKYGEENFTFEIIEECTLEQLDEREIYYISKYDSHYNGYNNTDGGGGVRGWKHSEEFKQKMKLSNKLNPRHPKPEHIARLIEYNKTRDFHHSEATKKKMSITHKGKKLNLSDEQRQRISLNNLRSWAENPERRLQQSERCKGKNNPIHKITKEQRELINKKISAIHKGRKRPPETCKKIGNLHRGTKYMTNGKENKRVREAEFDKYLNLGYTFGRTKYWLKEE